MTINVMLDLETWGTTPGSDIRSIGACVFDPHAGTVGAYAPYTGEANLSVWDDEMWSMIADGRNPYLFYVAVDNPTVATRPGVDGDEPIRKHPLKRDPRTAQWWNEQSDEATAAFANPVDLRDGLERFARWLDSIVRPGGVSDTLRLWSHGSHFDGPILAAAYEAVGLPVPWHYRAPRDTRTCFDMAGIADHSAHLAAHPGPLGITHHALDDAICQARAVCAAYGRLKK